MNINVPYYNDCMCDGCMVKYFEQGLIHKDTPAHDDVMKILESRKTKVISGFPAVGKSVLTKESHYKVLDSDSSLFSWIREGERHPSFPKNYMNHIKENIGKSDYILVSSHDVVREDLEHNKIEYTIVYPSIELRDEYLERYRRRGNDEKFISFIGSNWSQFIEDINKETFPQKIMLKEDQFLSDVLNLI